MQVSNVIYNGKILKRNEVKINIEDRGYQFGDGVYEVIRVYNRKPFQMDAHIERLFESARKIFMDIPYSKTEIKSWIYKLINKEPATTYNVYVQVTRGVSVRNHVIPKDSKVVFTGYVLHSERPVEIMMNGARAVLVEDKRWLHCDIKSISLLSNVLAKKQATDQGAFEAILHRGEIVTEASVSNVWIVKEGKFLTHPANHLILNGITRQCVINQLDKHNLPYEEKPFTVEDLLNADEVFITSTTSEILPIVQVDDVRINNGKPGSETKRLQDLFVKQIEAECGSV